jgi:hypothetical protein
MVYSLKPTIITEGDNVTGFEFTQGKTICFRIMEFIIDSFNNLSVSPEVNASYDIFVGMVQSGLPSLHVILEESTGEDESTSSEGGSSGFTFSRGCNVVTLTIPITTTPPLEGTLAPLTIPMVPLWTEVLHPDFGLLPERLHAY